MAWIDAPIDGLTISLGQTIVLEGHAAGAEGIEHIEFWAGDELLLSQDSLETTGALTHFTHTWTPASAGSYTIQLYAYGLDGSVSPADSITLHVGSDPSDTTIEATPLPTIETVEPEITITPTLTPTYTPLPPTPTFTWVPPTETPVDTTGPNPPAPIAPMGGTMLACSGAVTLSWSSASDPSGINGYTVEVQRHSGDNSWSTAPGTPLSGITGTSTSLSVECGWYYRWRVRAQDGAGNWGSFSGWAEFAVNLF
jgi:hypothetical protein